MLRNMLLKEEVLNQTKGGLIMAQQTQSEIRYLTPPSVDVKKKKYCRFKRAVSVISTTKILNS